MRGGRDDRVVVVVVGGDGGGGRGPELLLLLQLLLWPFMLRELCERCDDDIIVATEHCPGSRQVSISLSLAFSLLVVRVVFCFED